MNLNPREVLSHSFVYSWFQSAIGADKFRRLLVERHIRPHSGMRILDIGCGTADILNHLPGVDYLGLDLNPGYIRKAEQRFKERGRFVCGNVMSDRGFESENFDVVLAIGLLHHLSDAEASALLKRCKATLKTGGRLITFDGCYAEGQSGIARFLLSWDRGEHVRDQKKYFSLASQEFSDIHTQIHSDLLRIPYTLLVMEMKK